MSAPLPRESVPQQYDSIGNVPQFWEMLIAKKGRVDMMIFPEHPYDRHLEGPLEIDCISPDPFSQRQSVRRQFDREEGSMMFHFHHQRFL